MMLLVLTVANALSFFACILLELKYRSPMVLFFLVLFTIFFVPNALYLNEVVPNVHAHEAIVRATVFVSLVNVVYFSSRSLFNFFFRRRTNWVANDNDIERMKRASVPALALEAGGLASWLLGLLNLKGSFLQIGWTDTLSLGWYASVGNSLLFAGFGALLLAHLSKRRKIFMLSLLIGGLSVVLLRSRANLIPLFVPFLILFLFRNNKVNLKLKYFVFGLLFIFLVFFLQQFRYLGELRNFKLSETNTLIKRSFDQMRSTERGEFTLLNAFYKFVEHRNEYPAFGEGNTYKRLVLFFVPTKLANSFGANIKPRDFAMDMYAAYYDMPDNTIGTMHPTFYGDTYANFGFSGGLVFTVLFTFVIAAISECMARAGARYFFFTLPSMCFFVIFLARGAIYNGAFILLTSTFLYFAFIKYRFRFKSSDTSIHEQA